jgi:hypothetical protein
MPTNANTFNSRVTSEALEAKFREVFPSQGGAELPQDLFASGVIQPVVDFSGIAEGDVLPQNLQTAWDFSTGSDQITNTTTTLINNTGFWLVGLTFSTELQGTANPSVGVLRINDGATTKPVWASSSAGLAGSQVALLGSESFVVYLRSGDSLEGNTNNVQAYLDVWYRQIADINGNPTNPLGFSF